MPLEHHGAETEAASVRLSPDELQALMSDAIRRHGQAERAADPVDRSLATLDDAYEIARQLNIPEEHVRAAVAERQKGKLREQKREVIRRRRQRHFFATLGIALIATLGLLIGGMQVSLGGLAVLLWVAALILGFQAKAARIADADADRVDLPPQPGTCRVCGAAAYNERATFCDQHRYRGPRSPGVAA